MTFILGVDGGGTKTDAMIVTLDGEIAGFGTAGTSNWEMVGVEQTRQAVGTAMRAALSEARIKKEEISAAALGLAGLDWPSDEKRLAELVPVLELPKDTILVNDAYLALRAGTPQSYGVAVISGTGTATVGRNQYGQSFRTFAVGSDYCDFGSSAGIMKDAVRAVACAYIGRGPTTSLRESVLAYTGFADEVSLFEAMTRQNFKIIPDARLVFAAAEAGDQVAQDILQNAGENLAETAAAIATRLGMQTEAFDLVLAGGVFNAKYPLLLNTLTTRAKKLLPKANPVKLSVKPVIGAALLALEQRGWLNPERRERLSVKR